MATLFSSGTNNIINVPVDIRLGEFHTSESSITETGIEGGSIISNHIVNQPDTVEINAMISNIDGEGIETRGERSKTAFAEFKRFKKQRRIFDVLTTHELYQSMAIEQISADNVAPFDGRLNITIRFKQLPISQSNVTSVPVEDIDPSIGKGASGEVDAGRQDPVTEDDDRSLAAKSFDSIANRFSSQSVPDVEGVI